MRLRVLAAALLPLAAGGCASAGPQPGGGGAATGAPYAYVTNQDGASVSVIDLERRELAATVDLRELGFSAAARPHHVAVEPDGSHWYVTLIGEGKILKLDRGNRLLARADFETPGLLALHPDGRRLLVARSMTAVNPPRSVGVLRRADLSLETVEVLFPRPHSLSVHPGGAAAYTASLAVNQLAVVDLEGESARVQEVATAPADAAAGAHADHAMTLGHSSVSPDGRWMALTAELSGELLVFDLSDPLRPRQAGRIAVGRRPWHAAFSPDGRRVYVALKGDDAVAVVDAASWSVERLIRGEGLAEPDGVAVSPDGRTVVVSSSNTRGAGGRQTGSAVLIDAASGSVVRVLEIGRNPTGVGAPAPR